jgi:hypothetical protein
VDRTGVAMGWDCVVVDRTGAQMRCTSERVWHQGRGPSDPRRGRIHQCILASGHDGPCVYEGTSRTEPERLSAYARIEYRCETCGATYMGDQDHKCRKPVARVDLGKLFRENARRKFYGR